jgi:hypothetical protein
MEVDRRNLSIDVPKYDEFSAGAKDGSDETSDSKLDDEDLNDVERDVQDIVIRLKMFLKSSSSSIHL